jgi:hypothetical protein
VTLLVTPVIYWTFDDGLRVFSRIRFPALEGRAVRAARRPPAGRRGPAPQPVESETP